MNEIEALRALKRLAAKWPKTLWIFATGDKLYVIKTGPDGKREYANGGANPDFILDTINIPSDGGDW